MRVYLIFSHYFFLYNSEVIFGNAFFIYFIIWYLCIIIYRFIYYILFYTLILVTFLQVLFSTRLVSVFLRTSVLNPLI